MLKLLPGPYDVSIKIIEEAESSELFSYNHYTQKSSHFICNRYVCGTFFGLYMGRNERANVVLDDWLVLGLNVPALVIIILCYVWFGLNEVATILAVSLNKIPMVAVIAEGSRAIEKDYLDVAKFYKINKSKMFFRVILPQLYPYLLSSARSSLSLIWKIVLVVGNYWEEVMV